MDSQAAIEAELAQSPDGLSPGQLAALIGVSRQTVTRHLKKLVALGKVIKLGKTRNNRYVLLNPQVITRQTLAPPFPDEDRVFRKHCLGHFLQHPENVQDIAQYVFTEILNNAIEHAEATEISLQLATLNNAYQLTITDNGIGCFEKIRRSTNCQNHTEALAHLSKGKQTTAPEAHSGEGIFFSSKAVDIFQLESNELKWLVDNQRDDFALGDSDITTGTQVTCQLATNCKHRLEDIFRAYAVDEYSFDRTRIHVKLFEQGDSFISRSEAKRLLANLDAFKEIILDYRKVRIIGQGFADQIYRVYQTNNPGKNLISINASPAVSLMIKRAGGVI